MSYTFLQLPKAQKEILDAWEWYEGKQDGLGDRFKQDLAKKIKLIVSNPLQYPLKGKYRETYTDTFPYLVIYQIDDLRKLIKIVSVFHMSRYPKTKY